MLAECIICSLRRVGLSHLDLDVDTQCSMSCCNCFIVRVWRRKKQRNVPGGDKGQLWGENSIPSLHNRTIYRPWWCALQRHQQQLAHTQQCASSREGIIFGYLQTIWMFPPSGSTGQFHPKSSTKPHALLPAVKVFGCFLFSLIAFFCSTHSFLH